MALVASVFLGLVSVAHGVGDRLVSCQTPVDVRFIASAGHLKPEFSEEVAPGQKHWWSYQCQMETSVSDSYSDKNVADRKLAWGSNHGSSNWGDWVGCNGTLGGGYYGSEMNCTTTTTTTTTTASASPEPSPSPSPSPSSNNSNSSNSSNGTTTTAAPASGSTTKKKVTEAETTGCFATVFNPLVAGISLSLPFVMADDAPTQKASIDVFMPCKALTSALKDLDGDGSLDCVMTKEQSKIASFVPAFDGSWKVSAAHTVSHGRRLASPKHEGDNVTFDSGAMCMDMVSGAAFEHDGVLQRMLPTAVANVAGFTNKGKRCEEGEACEASMWSFDLTYPASECTPELPGWVRPCTAKMMPDGKLVLIRGQATTAGSVADRPPLMEDIEVVHDVLPFANGLAAAAKAEYDILVLRKASHVREKAFTAADVDANGALSFSEFEAVVNKLPETCADAF